MKKNSFIALALLISIQVSLAKPSQGQKQATNSASGSVDGSSGPLIGNITVAPSSGGQAPASSSATGLDGATASALDYLFNHKAQQGTTAYAGNQVAKALMDKIKAMDALKTPGGMDDPVVRDHFVTFLSLKPVPQDQIDQYKAKMDEINDLLKTGGQDNIVQAWKDLYALGNYDELDAGISKELAHRIEDIWGVDRTNNDLEKKNTDLRHDVDQATFNADVDASQLANTEHQNMQKKQGMANSSKKSGGKKSSSSKSNSKSSIPDPSDSLTAAAAVMPTFGEMAQGKAEMFDEFNKNVTARIKILLNERRENMENDAVRTKFSDYITTLYNDHRYYQVIIASAFYRNFFPDGDVPDDLGNNAVSTANTHANGLASGAQQIGKKFGGLNSTVPADMFNQFSSLLPGQKQQADKPLTIPEMVTAALEANSRVSNDVQVFQHKEKNGEVAAAATELQQAFVDNEFHPDLKVLPQDEKEKVGVFLDKLSVLKSQLENRAFELVDGQIAEIKKIAADFDATEPTTMAHTAQVQSMMLLGQAKLAAQKGDEKTASDAMAEALEVWPTNPNLITSGTTYFNAKDVGNSLTSEFDGLVKDQNYRAIAAIDKAPLFAAALKDDPARTQQLTDAVEKVKKAEAASEKANYMAINGDVDGAWETIELAVKDWPDDMKLNKLLASFSERSANFVSALDKARDAEAKKEYGYSLTWYVNAQSCYPASVLANDGIDRMSKQILSPQSTSTPASSSTADVN